jgi:hypothetical protein
MAAREPSAERILKTLGYVLLDDLLVMHVSRSTPSEEDWSEWIARSTKVDYRALLIATSGGSPNSAQRARLADAINKLGRPLPSTVLLTDSALMRSVMTAFSWLLGRDQRMKALPPSALAEALHWLDNEAAPGLVQAALRRIANGLMDSRPDARR